MSTLTLHNGDPRLARLLRPTVEELEASIDTADNWLTEHEKTLIRSLLHSENAHEWPITHALLEISRLRDLALNLIPRRDPRHAKVMWVEPNTSEPSDWLTEDEMEQFMQVDYIKPYMCEIVRIRKLLAEFIVENDTT